MAHKTIKLTVNDSANQGKLGKDRQREYQSRCRDTGRDKVCSLIEVDREAVQKSLKMTKAYPRASVFPR